nr:hypothetical protein [uncultured Pseudomonas sp.]
MTASLHLATLQRLDLSEPTMLPIAHSSASLCTGVSPAALGWPRDALLRRRRAVLFAFTFSPHAA